MRHASLLRQSSSYGPLIRVVISMFARVGARSIPGPHRGGPGIVIPVDQ
jgi:hypothetical protein